MTTRVHTMGLLAAALSSLLVAPAVFAQSGVLFVEGDNVGIGTSTPTRPLHLVRADPAIGTMLLIENTGAARITFNNQSAPSQWSFGQENNDRFAVNRAGSGTQEFAIAPNGDVLVSGAVVHSSSRTKKEGFQLLDPEGILAKVETLPITEWSYKVDHSAIRHVGPMAEDFYAAFGLGEDDKHIAINDSAGVALAAIQGLDRLVEKKDAEIQDLYGKVAAKDAQLADLQHRLEALERQMKSIEEATK